MKKATNSPIPNIYGEFDFYPQEDVQKAAENFVHFLYSTHPFTSKALSKRVLRALFYKKDEVLLTAIQKELEHFSAVLVEALQKGVSASQEQLIEMLFGHILSIYPFLEPQTKTLKIPQKISTGYELVDYKIERLELTPAWLGSPLTAFGLTSDSGSPLLLFMGTPQRTASGSFLSLWSDCAPGCTVGELTFFLFAKDKIAEWLERTDGNVKVYGKSLGGSLGILTACTFFEKIAEVHAYSPPAPFGRTLRRFDRQKKEAKKAPKVCIYWQANDFIPLVGSGFHKDWQLFYLVPEKIQNWFLAHIRSVPAFDHLEISSIDPTLKNRAILRRFTTFFSHILLIPIFLLVSLVLCIKVIIEFCKSLFL